MRSRLTWVVTVLGALLVLAGCAVMVVLGPDNRLTSGPHGVETSGVAVVTAPGVLRWSGVQVDVLAEVPAAKPVFVGIGNTVDVEDLVADTERLEITAYQTPWELQTRETEGRPVLPGTPVDLDWWLAQSAGLGGAAISLELPDEPVSLAVLSVGSANLTGLEVTIAYGVRGGFGKGAGAALLGVALALGAQLVRRDRMFQGPTAQALRDWQVVEEEVFVWVDEFGVEHELTAEELEGFEVVEEHDVVEVAAEPEPEPEPDRPARPRRGLGSVMTAADFVADPHAAVPEPEPDPGPEPEPEPVVFVWVDDDGVEHEVAEDELAGYEIVDEEDENR